MSKRTWFSAVAILALVACGGGSSTIDGPGGDGTDAPPGTIIDGGPTPDGVIPVWTDGGILCGGLPCQCSDGVDNDGDDFVDGFDPECVSALDNDEGSFATGISGDNKDSKWQDCFFDGNSGAGDDGCRVHTCCILSGECPDSSFNETTDCVVDDVCLQFCAPMVVPCCDCFGCCTLCNTDGCFTVMTNPAVAPDCTQETLSDPSVCPACELNPTCSSPPDPCTLCPGDTELPAECTEATCPEGLTPCPTGTECPSNYYCSAGCCIESVIVP